MQHFVDFNLNQSNDIVMYSSFVMYLMTSQFSLTGSLLATILAYINQVSANLTKAFSWVVQREEQVDPIDGASLGFVQLYKNPPRTRVQILTALVRKFIHSVCAVTLAHVFSGILAASFCV